MKIELPVHGIVVALVDSPGGGGVVVCSPDLYETCSYCGSKDCCFQCDESTTGGSGDDEEFVASRLAYNGAVDGIMSMVLAHAVSGIDVESPAYLEGIETALQASSENI